VDGLDVRRSTLRADGEFGTLFQAPFPPMTGNGQPVDELTIRRCTLDGAALASLSSIVGGTAAAGPRRIVLEDVAIQDNHRDTIALLNSGEVIASRVSIVGNGTSILSTLDSSLTRLRQIQVTGGRAGFVVADGPTGTVEGIDIADMEVDLGYQAATRWEAVVPVAFGPLHVDVEAHVQEHRRLYDVLRVLTPVAEVDVEKPLGAQARPWDRLELADGTWCQVLEVTAEGLARLDRWRRPGSWCAAPDPSGVATLFRVTLGRLFGWTASRLSLTANGVIPAGARWRGVQGEYRPPPSLVPGTRVDVLRHGYTIAGQPTPPRDVDTGGIHVTRSARSARLANVVVRRGFSDMITLRGVDTVADACVADAGQDMAFTVDGTAGPQTLRGCKASRTGMNGFHLLGGPSSLHRCHAANNGLHGYGYGVMVEPAAAGSFLQVRTEGDALGAVHGAELADAPLERPRPGLRRSRRTW
jgi:hypothetical protein